MVTGSTNFTSESSSVIVETPYFQPCFMDPYILATGDKLPCISQWFSAYTTTQKRVS